MYNIRIDSLNNLIRNEHAKSDKYENSDQRDENSEKQSSPENTIANLCKFEQNFLFEYLRYSTG